MGLQEGYLVVQIHCGSRGFGHQICTDYVSSFQEAVRRYNIHLPDRELVCAPLSSPEGQDYLAAMRCAANYAFANRQVLAHHARQAFEEVLAGKGLTLAAPPGLRYRPQHGQDRNPHDRRSENEGVRAPQRGHARLSDPAIPSCPKNIRLWASRCWCRAAWARPRGCWWAPKTAWSVHLAHPATGPGG